MEKVSAGTAQKMGLTALTLVTASNMMGSGVFMLVSILGKEHPNLKLLE